MIPLPLIFTLYPYTTLFRSRLGSSSVILSRTFKKAISNKNSLAKEIKRVRDVERNISSWEDEEYMYNSRRVKHRSEEHTSELQSRGHLVCRLLLEKKKSISC